MAQTDPDDRPRPQYGEYASAQEQRAHIRQPERATAHTPAPVPQPAVAARRAAPHARRASTPGRVITVLLLAYGAVNVLVTVPSLLNLAATVTPTYRRLGIPGTFTNLAGAHVWGSAAAVVLVVGFLATAWAGLRAVRRGRSAWWIPLVGAAATYIVVFVCLAVPLLGDPSFMAYVQHAR